MSVDSNVDSIVLKIGNLADHELAEISDTIIRKAAMDIVAETAKEWPVDTGRSRAAWIAAGQEADPTASQGHMEINVSNPVDYAPYIEYGTISRPPGGHLQRAMRIVRDDVMAAFSELFSGAWSGGR